ncbi:MAG: serine protease [Actinoplanes sp.]|nr:serine protease [Actinoplanes sp.]
MRFHLRRYAFGALASGTVAAAAALVVPFAGAVSWTPVPFGLAADPAQILPATVSAANPVSVVSTVLDSGGRPVVTVRTATDRASAERLVRAGQKAPHAIGVELDATVSIADALTGTDPYRVAQWDLAKVNVPAAWQRSTGAGVTVAVIDTGVDAGHPDLAGQILPGIDLITKTSGVSSDPNGHGTHVSGTIAALAGNGIGIAGVAPDAKILPIRVLGANGSGLMSDVATGLVYAADHGAQVVNMSIGSSGQTGAVSTAIGYARSKGVVVVAAAGNERASGSPISYPAADVGVIAVASTDSADHYSSFSNQGGYVDIAAPGSTILSTIPVTMGGYGNYSGTSMASPHIAAVAALLKAYRPGLSPDQVEQAIEKSAIDLGTAGKDTDYGYGRVDAAAALATVAPSPSTSTSSSTSPTPTVSATTTPPVKPTATPTVTPTIVPTVKPTIVPTVTPTVSPVRVTPVVTSTAASTQVVYGTTATTTFTVTAQGKPWAAAPAQACISENAAAFRCTAVATSATGTVTVSRSVTGPYQVRLVVVATPTSNEVTSATYAYTARAEATLTKSGNQSLTAVISGATGQTTQVQQADGQTWRTLITYPAAAKAVVSGLRPGLAYRIVVAATASVAGATSNTVQF